MEKLMRFDITDFLNVSEGSEAETYAIMGTGFNSLNESPNAQVDTKAYVSDKSASSTTTGYQGQFPFEADMIKDQRVIMKLYKIGRDQKTGVDAEVDYVRVETFEAITGKDKTFAARKFRCSVEISDISGEGAQPLVVSGNLNQVGDFIDGEFNTETLKFTSAAEATPAT